MPLDTFTESATYGTELEHNDAVLVAKFGDSYEQRAADGINTQRLRIAVEFSNVTKAKATRVLAFLRAHGGRLAFKWTAPDPYNDKERQWVCRPPFNHTWEAYDNHTVRAIFEEDFTIVP